MRGSLKVPTAARHISWVIITGVTFCAVCIYVLGFSAESAADQSAELQIQRVFFSPEHGRCGCASDKPAIGVHSLRAGHRQQMCALLSLLSFMSSLYPMLLLGNIIEIAMETCPVI